MSIYWKHYITDYYSIPISNYIISLVLCTHCKAEHSIQLYWTDAFLFVCLFVWLVGWLFTLPVRTGNGSHGCYLCTEVCVDVDSEPGVKALWCEWLRRNRFHFVPLHKTVAARHTIQASDWHEDRMNSIVTV